MHNTLSGVYLEAISRQSQRYTIIPPLLSFIWGCSLGMRLVFMYCVHDYVLHQALGEDFRGICTDYHAEPGLGLSCSVELSAVPNAVDQSVEMQCVRLTCNFCPPLVNTTHICKVQLIHVNAHQHMDMCMYIHTCTLTHVLAACTCTYKHAHMHSNWKSTCTVQEFLPLRTHSHATYHS